MAAKEDDGSANDLHFGPITIDVPDDLSDIKRDLKFYQKVGEAYESGKGCLSPPFRAEIWLHVSRQSGWENPGKNRI